MDLSDRDALEVIDCYFHVKLCCLIVYFDCRIDNDRETAYNYVGDLCLLQTIKSQIQTCELHKLSSTRKSENMIFAMDTNMGDKTEGYAVTYPEAACEGLYCETLRKCILIQIINFF